MNRTTLLVVPGPRRDTDPNLPTTPDSIVRATAPGFAHHKRAWELHGDGKWCDTHTGARRSPSQLRDIEVLYVAPDLEGAA